MFFNYKTQNVTSVIELSKQSAVACDVDCKILQKLCFNSTSTEMLGNLKEFISVVQDGITSNSNIRHTLQEVQRVKNIFKDKQRIVSESTVNCGAGGALLEKYKTEWAELHENADKNAKAAEEADKLILELHEAAKLKLQTASDLAQNLTHLPSLTASIAQCIDSLKNVEDLMKTVEQDLVEFEDIAERSKMEKWKLDHHYHLTLYKEKKMGKLFCVVDVNKVAMKKILFAIFILSICRVQPKCSFISSKMYVK